MKKYLSILLSLLMVLSLAACVSVKTPSAVKAPAEPAAQTEAQAVAPAPEAQAEAQTEAPAPEAQAEAQTEAPASEAPAEATPAPTEAPTPTPASTEVPFEVAIAEANAKLREVKSLHMDMEMDLSVEIGLTMGEMQQVVPIDANMVYSMDLTTDPYLAKVDLSLAAMGENMSSVIYAAREGENLILYTSNDEGVTWTKQVDPQDAQLPQAPAETITLLADANVNIQRTGTAEVNGRQAAVYSGTVDGQLIRDILNSTGASGELAETLGTDMAEDVLANLSDISVTFLIDEESGLPVQYTIDMSAAIRDLLEAALQTSLAGETLDGMEITVDVPALVLDIALSQFDSVEPIEIPEEALNAPEA